MFKDIAKAYDILKILSVNGTDFRWEKPEPGKFALSLFTPERADMYPNDMFFVVGKDDTVIVVGKYEDRYYYDEESYNTEYGYFISIGKKVEDLEKIDSIATFFEKDFYDVRLKDSSEIFIKDVFNSIVMSLIEIDKTKFISNFS